MHVLWFALKTKEPTSRNEVIDKLEANKLVSLTTKDMTSTLNSYKYTYSPSGKDVLKLASWSNIWSDIKTSLDSWIINYFQLP